MSAKDFTSKRLSIIIIETNLRQIGQFIRVERLPLSQNETIHAMQYLFKVMIKMRNSRQVQVKWGTSSPC